MATDPHAGDHVHGHPHEHTAHDHGSGVLGRVRHLASETFGGHTHDTADQIDDALEAHAAGRRALWTSLAALLLTAVLQAAVFALTSSVAVLGDTLHNLVDALTAVPLLVAFTLSRRPANDRYTYGYGRSEDLGGLFVVAMIALSSGVAGYEAVRRLLEPHPVHHLWAVAGGGVIGFLGNELVARYRIGVGRRIGSAALVADGLHARTDGFASLAVLIGAGGVALGWHWADPVIGLVITLAILAVLRSAVAQVGARLLDAVDPELVRQVRHCAGGIDGVRRVQSVRMRWVGHELRGEVDVLADPRLSLTEADAVAARVEAHLRADVRRLADVCVNVGPEGPGDPDLHE